MWYSPGAVAGPGLARNRTVIDSSSRSNLTVCSGGVTVQPAGTSRLATTCAGPVVSLTIVTRISRSAGGGAAAAATAGAGRSEARPLPDWPGGVGEPRPAGVGGFRLVDVGWARSSDRGALRIDAAGTIAISGDTRTENAGATSSSVRFSPLKMLPS